MNSAPIDFSMYLRKRTSCSPSPQPSPSGTRRFGIQSCCESRRVDLVGRSGRFSLSLRERVGVRGKETWFPEERHLGLKARSFEIQFSSSFLLR